jgi:uncharacterized protein (TIGR02246 family)
MATNDEREIRELVAAWMSATRAGDVDAVLALMTEDALFLSAGRPPMGRDQFAAASREMAKPGGPRFDGRNEIREIVVDGDLAFVRGDLTVEVTPPTGAPFVRTGPVLTVFRRERGRWRLARDANMLAVAESRDASAQR